jgi:hypothetical protein
MPAYSAGGRRLGDSSTIGDTSFRDLFRSKIDQKWAITVYDDLLLAQTHGRSIRQSPNLSIDERHCGKDGHSGEEGGLEDHLGGSRTR